LLFLRVLPFQTPGISVLFFLVVIDRRFQIKYSSDCCATVANWKQLVLFAVVRDIHQMVSCLSGRKAFSISFETFFERFLYSVVFDC